MGIKCNNWLLFALFAVLSWPVAQAADPAKPATVRDLVYGEILFDFYQDRYLEAITRHLVADQRGELDFHAEESDLLSGGMYLAYGQQSQAESIFDRLLQQRASPQVQQQARLQLARSHYLRGAFDNAAGLIAGQQWDDDVVAEATALAANSLLRAGRHAEAAAILGNLDKSPATAFARYNLGVALAGQGQFDAAAAQLASIARMQTTSRRLLFFNRRNTDTVMPALADKARLALGYALIRQGRADEALQTLDAVDLQGPHANASLLGAGWAAAEMQRFDIALNAWQVLQQRDSADPAVQEAWFAVPYALGELSAHSQAASAFENSIAAIENEDQAMVAAIAALDTDGLAPLLLGQDKNEPWDAGWHLAQPPDHPLTRYLYMLMADNVFQQHLRDFRDLISLGALLDRKRSDLESYRNSLQARSQKFSERAPLVHAALSGEQLDKLQQRAVTLRQTKSRVEQDRDFMALASTDELEQLESLNATQEKIARLPAAQAVEAGERLRLLQGLLRWRLSGDYAARLHTLDRDLARVQQEIAAAQSRERQLAGALDLADGEHAAFSQRLDAMLPRITTAQQRITRSL
ncbi:MAG: tetratricopeptide repeat protein, partial [Gammaproteobacteria bacterium]|nr:tetratricopeptide repeat protein [Gammaproteobacteria bacterium]